MKQNILRFLPLFIIFFSVVGVLSWYATNKKDAKEIKPEVVNPSSLGSSDINTSPTPSSFFFSDEPATIPETTPSDQEEADPAVTTNTAISTTTRKTTICTPVYGMADSCTEHIVVDTGAESAVAYSLSALSHLGGLIAFVKSKKA
jgi:hypothetical protein